MEVAILKSRPASVHLLLEFNADVRWTTILGETMMSLAVAHDNQEIINLLQLREAFLSSPI